MTRKTTQTRAPKHLAVATRRWWNSVVSEYCLEEHHRRLLTLAGESWDRTEAARKAIETHGMTFVDRFGQPRARPEIAIERDSRNAFARMIRELGLDLAEPEAQRKPPTIAGKIRAVGG